MSLSKIIQFLETVKRPKAEAERAFVRKHFIQKHDYPVEDEAVFKAPTIEKDRTKEASYEDGEDELVYENIKIAKNSGVTTIQDGIRRSFPLHPEHQEKIKNLKDGEGTYFRDETNAKVYVQKHGDKYHFRMHHHDSLEPTIVKHQQLFEADIVRTNRADKKASIIHTVDPKTGEAKTYTKRQATGEITVGKSNVKEELTPLQEISKKMLGRYIKAAVDNKAYLSSQAEIMKNVGDDVKQANRKSSGEFGDPEKFYNKSAEYSYNSLKRKRGISKAVDKLVKEAFVPGPLKLKDGSSINVNLEQSNHLNKLFNQLNSTNKNKMEEQLTSSKNNFYNVLSFAEEL